MEHSSLRSWNITSRAGLLNVFEQGINMIRSVKILIVLSFFMKDPLKKKDIKGGTPLKITYTVNCVQPHFQIACLSYSPFNL